MVHKNYCFPKIALKLLFRKFWVIKQLFTVGYISASRTNSFCQQFSLVGILALHIQVKASTADLHPQPVTFIKKKKNQTRSSQREICANIHGCILSFGGADRRKSASVHRFLSWDKFASLQLLKFYEVG